MTITTNLSSSTNIAGELLLYVSAIPPWSLVSHLLVAGAILGLKRAVRRSRHFSLLNEFLCTTLWVSWTLECYVIGFASSSLHSLFVLFVRLLVGPLLFDGAHVSPCTSIFTAVKARSGKRLLPLLSMQLVAMVTALFYSFLAWRFLSQWLSEIHQHFLEVRPNHFLRVPAWIGFGLELAMTFVSFLPHLVFQAGYTCTFVSAVVCCALVFLLEGTTGAFMNPVVAASTSLVWHPYGPRDLLLHVLVYWLGPFTGAVLAGKLLLVLRRKDHID